MSPRFLTDDMLGKLTRWLRMMGYDTVYAPDRGLTDAGMEELAEGEDRILVTRDRDLQGKAVVLESNDIEGQLRELMQEVEIDVPPEPQATFCPKCNGKLEGIDKEEHGDEIPPRTYEETDTYWKCRDCGQVYWPGKHWEHIQETFGELG